MLKDTLIEQAKTIEVDVKLDGIFESVELSSEMQENFNTVFQTAVKKHAIALAETHINSIAEKADTLVAEQVEEQVEEIKEALLETADKLSAHVAQEYMAENKLAIDRGIKADLFESMFEGLKTLVVEHNVVLPEESVDVVAEMEHELDEAKTETNKLFESMNDYKTQLLDLKRSNAIQAASADLTESQKEKVNSLLEGMDYDDNFESKLTSIVEMATLQKTKSEPEVKPLTEASKTEDTSGLNYIPEEQEKPQPAQKSKVNTYAAAARKF